MPDGEVGKQTYSKGISGLLLYKLLAFHRRFLTRMSWVGRAHWAKSKPSSSKQLGQIELQLTGKRKGGAFLDSSNIVTLGTKFTPHGAMSV